MDNKQEQLPHILKVVQIDDRRIELYWDRQVRGADTEKNFEVCFNDTAQALTHWQDVQDQEWDYGTVYQKETMRTTLALSSPVCPEKGKLTVQITGSISDLQDRTADTSIIYSAVYEPYYVNFVTSISGITLRAGKAVKKDVLLMASQIIDRMLLKIPDVAQKLIENNADIGIYGLLENAYDIPEHRMGYWMATRHVEGFGGILSNPISTISEANVIRLRSGRYASMYPHEMILVHEFGHAIHLIGIDYLEDKTLRNRVRDCYTNARDSGLWPNTYLITNHEEYFATLSTIWFNVMQEGVDGAWDGIRGPVNTREELKEYDPMGYQLMSDLYMEEPLPYPWNYNTDFYGIDGRPKKQMRDYNIMLDEAEQNMKEWRNH